MSLNLRELILAADDLKREAVEVPEWATTVYVKTMNANERWNWLDIGIDKDGKLVEENRMGYLLVCCLVDADNKRIFTNDDAALLQGKNGDVIANLYVKAKRLNGMLAESVDTAEGNS